MATAAVQMRDVPKVAESGMPNLAEADRQEQHLPRGDKFMLVLLVACLVGLGAMVVRDLLFGVFGR